MPWSGILAVGGGAAVGAWMRWGLGIALNPLFPTLPLGTLAANLIGGLLMGFAMELPDAARGAAGGSAAAGDDRISRRTDDLLDFLGGGRDACSCAGNGCGDRWRSAGTWSARWP